MSDFDVNDPQFVSVYDDLPLWSAACGMLLLDTVELRPGLRVLDVGCGTGFPLLELAERLGSTSEVHGIDPWEPAVERARQKITARGVGNAHVIVGRADALPFPDAHFDLVVSNLGINNFDAPAAALAECRRVCRRGAEIALATNLQGTMAELYAAYEVALRALGLAELQARETITRLVSARTTVSEATRLVGTAGFAFVRVVESSFRMRFVDGRALLGHSFIRLAFLDSWAGAVDAKDRASALGALHRALEEIVGRDGEITLTVPIACIVARAA